MTTGWAHHRSARLLLSRPQPDDVDAWHVLHTDPRVWEHFPSGRHTALSQTEVALADATDPSPLEFRPESRPSTVTPPS